MNFRKHVLYSAITMSMGLTALPTWAQLEEVIVTAQ
ncbi:MAG: hypothetical protein RI942_1142, partial [Pseudomonadota bacterium]